MESTAFPRYCESYLHIRIFEKQHQCRNQSIIQSVHSLDDKVAFESEWIDAGIQKHRDAMKALAREGRHSEDADAQDKLMEDSDTKKNHH